MIPRISTFSIVAYDDAESASGIAVASKFPAVGAVVPWAAADAGAVATQSYANTTYGPDGLELMRSGLSAQEALNQLVAGDDESALRQVGLVDCTGQAATYSGEDCYDWAGGLTGDGYCVQGNILTGPEVIENMAAAFEAAAGELPTRLLASLLAGDRVGGDRRGRQSAAILVVKPEGGYAGFNDRWIDYRVDDHDDPVPQLMHLYELHGLYFGESDLNDQIQITGQVAKDLQAMMTTLKYYDGKVSGQYDQATRKSLREFIGNENFEDRTDLKTGLIDRPVLEYLQKKYPP